MAKTPSAFPEVVSPVIETLAPPVSLTVARAPVPFKAPPIPALTSDLRSVARTASIAATPAIVVLLLMLIATELLSSVLATMPAPLTPETLMPNE